MSKTIFLESERNQPPMFTIIKYFLKDLSRYTVTDELGDILEANYFCRKNGFEPPEKLMENMKKAGVSAYIFDGVINFFTKEDAEKGIEYFVKRIGEKTPVAAS